MYPRSMAKRRPFGSTEKLPSGRWRARFRDPETGAFTPGPTSFATKADADLWLAKARVALETALRLDPRGAHVPGALQQLVISAYFERDYEAAVREAHQLINTYPDFPRSYPWLAASLGQLGRVEEASAALHKAMSTASDYFDFLVKARPPWFRPEDYEHVLEGLRKAGWQSAGPSA